MGNAAPAAGGTMGQLMGSFVPLVLIIVIFYFMLIRPQQKKAKEHKAMLAALKPGDKIMTNGGFFGKIVEINDVEAIIDLGEVKVTVARGALNVVGPQSGASRAENDRKNKK